MATLPEADGTRCDCWAAVPGAPVLRCGWRATGEDMLCDGCRAFCARDVPMTFEPNAGAMSRLLNGGASAFDPTPHLIGPLAYSTPPGSN